MSVIVSRQNAAEVCPDGNLNRSDGATSALKLGMISCGRRRWSPFLNIRQIARSMVKASIRAATYAEAAGEASYHAVTGKTTCRYPPPLRDTILEN